MDKKHYPALDGLRGIAALMIVAHHSSQSYVLTSTFDKAYLRATTPLWIGVDLFFVLSGFLITNILLDTQESRNYFKAFYGRRFVRIFPLYYTFLAVLFLILPAVGVNLSPDLVHAQVWEWTYTSNIYDAFHNWQDININHFWTLAIEEQFYLLWPLIIFYASKKYLKHGVMLALLVIPLLRWGCRSAGVSIMFAYTFTLCHIDGLLVGALISIAFHEGLIEKLKSSRLFSKIRTIDWILAWSLLAFVLVYCFILTNNQFIFMFMTWTPFGQGFGLTFVSIVLGYSVLRAVSSVPNTLQRVMSLKYLRVIGKYSYALYVLHAPICHWVGTSFPIPSFLQNLSPEWSFAHSIYIIIVEFILSILASVISWNILEKHFLKLKKYFPYQDEGVAQLA